jgi:hypothetical protein
MKREMMEQEEESNSFTAFPEIGIFVLIRVNARNTCPKCCILS